MEAVELVRWEAPFLATHEGNGDHSMSSIVRSKLAGIQNNYYSLYLQRAWLADGPSGDRRSVEPDHACLPAGVESRALNSFPAAVAVAVAVAVAAAAKSSHGPDSCVVAFTKIFPPLPCLSLTQSTHPTTFLSTHLIHILESSVLIIEIQIALLFLLSPLKPATRLA
jgi:hypothetical protein